MFLIIISVPDSFKRQGVNKEFWGSVSPYLLKFSTNYFVGAGGQLSQVFDPRPLSYLKH